MYVPATVPIKVGHTIRLTVAGEQPPEVPDGAGGLGATVVRVDRHALLLMGRAAVGVRFDAIA